MASKVTRVYKYTFKFKSGDNTKPRIIIVISSRDVNKLRDRYDIFTQSMFGTRIISPKPIYSKVRISSKI